MTGPDSATVLLMHFDGDFNNDNHSTYSVPDPERFGNLSFLTMAGAGDFGNQLRLDNDIRDDQSHLQIPDANEIFSYEFTLSYDTSVVTYHAYEKQHTLSGDFTLAAHVEHDSLSISGAGSSPVTDNGTLLNLQFVLKNPATTIRYSVPKTSNVTVVVYNMVGRRIATLVDSEKEAGRYTVKFDGSNLSSGIYFYRMSTHEFSRTRRMLLVK